MHWCIQGIYDFVYFYLVYFAVAKGLCGHCIIPISKATDSALLVCTFLHRVGGRGGVEKRCYSFKISMVFLFKNNEYVGTWIEHVSCNHWAGRGHLWSTGKHKSTLKPQKTSLIIPSPFFKTKFLSFFIVYHSVFTEFLLCAGIEQAML